MNFNMKNRTIALTSALLFSAASAFAAGAQDSVVQEQKSLLQKLDSLQESVIGLKLNGTAKAGALASLAKSDQFSDDSPTHETQAYTDVNLLLTARPSSETMVTLQLRLHKDWQSGFDENNNPVIGHWFSYDGSILNKHLEINSPYNPWPSVTWTRLPAACCRVSTSITTAASSAALWTMSTPS